MESFASLVSRVVGLFYTPGAFNEKQKQQQKQLQSTPIIADTVRTSSWCPHLARVYLSQTSAICFCLGLAAVSIICGGASARRELTVLD